jgi:NAD(P)-dependent dehydrogenase (short-subunit alcohol dehydrogenase family)
VVKNNLNASAMGIPLTPDLSGKIAIVTGASRGIGLAIAQAFLQAGASVCLTARKQDELDAALVALAPVADAAGGRAVAFVGNAGDSEAIRACIAHVMDVFGRVDICVNNAATNPGFGQLMDVDMARYRKTMAVNVEGPLQFVQECWKAWMAQHGGVVLNITTGGIYAVGPMIGVYVASKVTLRYLTQQLAAELAPRVRVNSLSPGLVRTQMARIILEHGADEVAAQTPLMRIGEPPDIAQAATFLCSDLASWITGADLVVDGGALVQAAWMNRPQTAGGSPQIIQGLAGGTAAAPVRS